MREVGAIHGLFCLVFLVAAAGCEPHRADERDAGPVDGDCLDEHPCRFSARCLDAHRIGEFGMGHVFLAKHVSTGTRAAVKILPFGSTPAHKLRFAEEARLLSAQEHPNIVHLWDVGTMVDGSRYLVMEYASQMNLEEWLDCGEVRSPGRILGVLRRVARAIDHVHACGVVHRDITPANIMIDPAAGGTVKLLDFGIATREGDEANERATTLFGTPAYMAPEQAAGQPANRAFDIYALGALALELLTGKPPYECHSVSTTFVGRVA